MNEKLTLKTTMGSTWLIQRLQKPKQWEIGDKKFDNPFSFGGGLKNGGLNDKAMDLIRPIFSFDYMGASEFEWGAVPNALHFLGEQAQENNLIAASIEPNQNETIYFICPREYKNEVINRLILLRQNKIQLCKWSGLSAYFDDKKGHFKETVGWLELDNGFMFFVDKNMFAETCRLFGSELETK